MRVRRVVYAKSASDDLLQMLNRIAREASPEVAVRYVERVEAYCDGLAIGSERGTRRDDIRPGVRIVGFERSLTIAFAVRADHVRILRVFGRGENWEKELRYDPDAP